MSNDELKEALLNRRPVIAWWPTTGDIEFQRVCKIEYGVDDGDNIVVSAQLLSINGRSVTHALPQNIRYK